LPWVRVINYDNKRGTGGKKSNLVGADMINEEALQSLPAQDASAWEK
jgi:hypothetical protein